MSVAPQLAGAWPLVGHLPHMQRDPLATLLAASRLGDVARLDLGPRGAAYLVSHPEGVKHVLLDNRANYTKQTRGFAALRAFLGQGLLTSEGELWRRQRRIAQPAFHHARLSRFAETMTRAAVELAGDWQRLAQPFDVAEQMMRLTLRIVGECLFSVDPRDEASELGAQIEVLLEQFINRIMAPVVLPASWSFARGSRVRRAIRTMHEMVDGMIAERRERGPGAGHGDLLDMLMTAEDAATGERMSAQQLRDEVLTLLVAGHETTAAALSWTWVLLARHPEVDGRLAAELAALGLDVPALGDLERLPLTGQVIQEALRLYPPAWIFARCAVADDEIRGVRIPAGRLVIVSPWVIHRRPDLFPEPERFAPERFAPEAMPAGGHSKFAYIPFGAGPRICIGNGFALMEARLVLATLRRRFRLDLAPGAEIEPLPLLTLRAKHGVPVLARPVPR